MPATEPGFLLQRLTRKTPVLTAETEITGVLEGVDQVGHQGDRGTDQIDAESERRTRVQGAGRADVWLQNIGVGQGVVARRRVGIVPR